MRPFGEPHGLFARFVRGVRPDTFPWCVDNRQFHDRVGVESKLDLLLIDTKWRGGVCPKECEARRKGL